ncbi:MAG: hypothetical protein HY555_00725 [Euryarchaeota archaeon]|nr:hypothetical protein [Euryarchaeota archaeon]
MEPFRFYTRFILPEYTGKKAINIMELAEGIREVPDSSIYYHTHNFLQEHHYLTPEPPSDFAHWVGEVLLEASLGECLAGIDTCDFSSIPLLRQAILKTIEDYLAKGPPLREAPGGMEFYFIKANLVVAQTRYTATNLQEFLEALRKVGICSIYFHLFEARLRLGREKNDFSHWIADSVGDEELANEISSLNPYTYTLENLREALIGLVEERVKG